MKNMHLLILGSMMIVATGYALEEPQGFIDVYAIQTKNHKHREVLDIMHESSRNGARAIMSDHVLIAVMIRIGQHEVARQMRMRAREQALELQEYWKQEAQQQLNEWGYPV